MYVFCDSAGKLSNKNERSLVLVALICSQRQKREIDARCEEIKAKAAEWGISQSKFEFHAYELFTGGGRWKTLDVERRMQIAEDLRNVIVNTELRVVIIKLDKNQGAERSVRRFSKGIKSFVNTELNKVPPDQLKEADQIIQKKLGKKGFGPLAGCYQILFGMTSGLLHWDTYSGLADVVADRDFLRMVPAWNYSFGFTKAAWPLIRDTQQFPGWPKGKPSWHLEDSAIEEESHKEYGLQLADYIAYTLNQTRHRRFRVEKYVVIAPCFLKQFLDFPGILLGVQGRAAVRPKIRFTNVKTTNPNGYREFEFGK